MREAEFQRRILVGGMRPGVGIRLQPRATGRPLGGAKLRPDTCRQRQARVTDKQAALIRRACEPPALHTAVPGQARPQAGRAPHTPAPHARGDPGCGRARRRGAGRRGGRGAGCGSACLLAMCVATGHWRRTGGSVDAARLELAAPDVCRLRRSTSHCGGKGVKQQLPQQSTEFHGSMMKTWVELPCAKRTSCFYCGVLRETPGVKSSTKHGAGSRRSPPGSNSELLETRRH